MPAEVSKNDFFEFFGKQSHAGIYCFHRQHLLLLKNFALLELATVAATRGTKRWEKHNCSQGLMKFGHRAIVRVYPKLIVL